METLDQLSNANILVCATLNKQGVILNSNTVFNAYFKNSLNKNYRYLISEDCQAEVESVCSKCISNPGHYFLLQVRARIVGHKWAWFSFEVFYSERSKVFGIIGVKAAENDSKDSLLLDRYRSRMREIAFIQAHELRGPLSRIMGLSNLQKDSEDFQEVKKLAVIIWDASSELDSVIKKNIGLTSLED